MHYFVIMSFLLLSSCARYGAEIAAVDAAEKVERKAFLEGTIDRFCSMPMDILSDLIDEHGYDFRAGFRLICGTRNINIWNARPVVPNVVEDTVEIE